MHAISIIAMISLFLKSACSFRTKGFFYIRSCKFQYSTISSTFAPSAYTTRQYSTSMNSNDDISTGSTEPGNIQKEAEMPSIISRKSILTSIKSRMSAKAAIASLNRLKVDDSDSSSSLDIPAVDPVDPVITIQPIEETIIYNEFSKLGLINDIVKGVFAQGFTNPTPVQKAVIPRLMTGENLVMAASTGSGKTLAFTLPVIQDLIAQESNGYKRQPQRPRCLILVPTRELARQILGSIKSISHFAKMSSAAVLGGESYAVQKESLDRLVDIVVASPGRLMQHKEKGNVFLSHVSHVIIDEVDTMLTQGFGPDIRAILRATLNKHSDNHNDTTSFVKLHNSVINTKNPAQIIMATATLTKAVKELLNDVNGNFNIEFSDSSNKTPKKLNGTETSIRVNVVEVDGVHRTLPHVQHLVEDTKGEDKLVVLNTVIERFRTKKLSTLIFCNTVAACRAVEYSLNETNINPLSYHGDLNSKERSANLDSFRSGDCKYLVCSDIAARGLDIPDVGHVIMFDFPLNPVDYIHRAGRCGRAGRKGIVTAIVTKRDKVLSDAIQGAIARGLPIDNLSSSKRDYTDKGKLGAVIGRVRKPSASKPTREKSYGSLTRQGGRKQRGENRKEEKTDEKKTTSKIEKGGFKKYLGVSGAAARANSQSSFTGTKRKRLG